MKVSNARVWTSYRAARANRERGIRVSHALRDLRKEYGLSRRQSDRLMADLRSRGEFTEEAYAAAARSLLVGVAYDQWARG